MDIIKYKCLEGFHRRFTESDSSPELTNLTAFSNMMVQDYSAENLISKIIDTDDYWETMLNTNGFGRGIKYEKAQAYRNQLKESWKNINDTFNSENEADISKVMGTLLWNMDENTYNHSYLGAIEAAMIQNELWDDQASHDIFCSYFGFVGDNNKSLDIIANERNQTTQNIRNLKKNIYISRFEDCFWFLNDRIILNKCRNLFNIEQYSLDQIKEQAEQVNKLENVHFSADFYTIILAKAFDLVLIGDIENLKHKKNKTSLHNPWNNLYLQTKHDNRRCNLKGLINALELQMPKKDAIWKDLHVDIEPFVETPLNVTEIERYNAILDNEFAHEIELKPTEAIIKRTTKTIQAEMAENALRELGGFTYDVDILAKVIEMHSGHKWDMLMMKAAISKNKNIYAIGKSGLFGLKDVKDLRREFGNGTINDVIRIYLLRHDTPIHIFELLEHINKLFLRAKKINNIQTVLSQNSRGAFTNYDAGFYGLKSKKYDNTTFSKTFVSHSTYLRQIIKDSNGLSFESISEIFNKKYELLEIQIRYLLDRMIQKHGIKLIDGSYTLYIPGDNRINEEIYDSDTFLKENNIEIDEEEDGNEEGEQPNIPDELKNDAFAQIEVRRGQPKFRKKLLILYKSTCIVTGCKIVDLLEAAHIMPHSEKQDYRKANGLLLRADIHTLFDLGLIAINPENMKLKMTASLVKSGEYVALQDLDIGDRLKRLKLHDLINKDGLNWRWKSFIEAE